MISPSLRSREAKGDKHPSPGVSSAAHKDHRSSLTSLVTFYSYHTGSFHLFTAPITSEEPDVYVYSFGARDGEATVVVNDKL